MSKLFCEERYWVKCSVQGNLVPDKALLPRQHEHFAI